jgi:hypothetical protein
MEDVAARARIGSSAGRAGASEETIMSTTTHRPTTQPPRRSTAWLTGGLHLLALWPYAISGLFAPGWGVGALLVVWALMGVVAVAVHRRWGGLAALVPLVTVGLWFLLATLGEQLLGWTG